MTQVCQVRLGNIFFTSDIDSLLPHRVGCNIAPTVDSTYLLRGWSVSPTLAGMGKKQTEQVRLPVDLMEVVRRTAPALGETPGDYIARVVREALKRDIPRAAKVLDKLTPPDASPAKEET